MPDPDGSTGEGRPRRWLLRSLAVGSVAGLAGCNGPGSGSNADPPATAGEPPASATGEAPTTTTSTDGRTTTETGTGEGTEVSVPTDVDGDLRDRVAQVGETVRPTVVFLNAADLPAGATGVFLEPSLVVTAASTLEVTGDVVVPPVETVGGETYDASLVGRVSSQGDRDTDIAALRVDAAEPTLPGGSAAALSPDDVVVQVSTVRDVGQWVTQFGRVESTLDDGSFVTTLPYQTPGAPVVTLDGDLVAVTTGGEGVEPPADERPPPTADRTVYTDQSQWSGVRQAPISEVQSAVDGLLSTR